MMLILSRKFLVDPEELLAFVHHADETTEAGVFGFKEGVQFAEQGSFGTLHDSMGKIRNVGLIFPVGDFVSTFE